MHENGSASSSEMEVTNQVLIALRKIIQAIDLHSRHLVKQVGLTGPQLIVLNEVKRAGNPTVGDIAKAISLSQATVTGVLERLERRGYVLRSKSNSDRRKVLVSATENGLKILSKAPSLMQASFVKQFNNLKGWEQSMMLSCLQRLVDMMDAKTISASPVLTTGPIDSQPGDEQQVNAIKK